MTKPKHLNACTYRIPFVHLTCNCTAYIHEHKDKVQKNLHS